MYTAILVLMLTIKNKRRLLLILNLKAGTYGTQNKDIFHW
jgi:hypothetical protein